MPVILCDWFLPAVIALMPVGIALQIWRRRRAGEALVELGGNPAAGFQRFLGIFEIAFAGTAAVLPLCTRLPLQQPSWAEMAAVLILNGISMLVFSTRRNQICEEGIFDENRLWRWNAIRSFSLSGSGTLLLRLRNGREKICWNTIPEDHRLGVTTVLEEHVPRQE